MWCWARRWWQECPASWQHRRLPCLHCPLPEVGSREWVSVEGPGSLTLGFCTLLPSVTAAFPTPGNSKLGLLQMFAKVQGWGNQGPERWSAWPRNTQQRTGGHMLTTYQRSRRNVHSLAQPTVETRGRGQAHLLSAPGLFPPTWNTSQHSICTAFTGNLYCPNLSDDIFPPQRGWLREGCRRGWHHPMRGPSSPAPFIQRKR